MLGCSPLCTMVRVAATACGEGREVDARGAPPARRSWIRIHASVITPSAPSEPSTSRSGFGPAPEPGSRRDSLVPVGVPPAALSVRSSMWVAWSRSGRRRGWPATRRGWRTRTTAGSAAASGRAGAAGPRARAEHPGLDARRPGSPGRPRAPGRAAVRSRLIAGASKRGSTPPTTEVPPPKGTTATPAVDAQSRASRRPARGAV